MKWQAGTIGEFYDRGEDTVVYFDPANGDTHLVSEFSAFLIQRLAETCRPLTLPEIVALATDEIEPGDLAELRDAIPGILNELVDLDIVAAT